MGVGVVIVVLIIIIIIIIIIITIVIRQGVEYSAESGKPIAMVEIIISFFSPCH